MCSIAYTTLVCRGKRCAHTHARTHAHTHTHDTHGTHAHTRARTGRAHGKALAHSSCPPGEGLWDVEADSFRATIRVALKDPQGRRAGRVVVARVTARRSARPAFGRNVLDNPAVLEVGIGPSQITMRATDRWGGGGEARATHSRARVRSRAPPLTCSLLHAIRPPLGGTMEGERCRAGTRDGQAAAAAAHGCAQGACPPPHTHTHPPLCWGF